MTAARWNGSSFVGLAHIRRWTGSAWADVSFARRWDGSAWVEFWPAVKLTNTSKTIEDSSFVASPGTANNTAGLGFQSGGALEAFATSLSGSWFEITPSDEWLIPRGADASRYEIRATTAPAGVVSTNTAGGAVGMTTWSSLSAGRRFSVSSTRSTLGIATTDSGAFVIEIRDASTLALLASCTARLISNSEVI